MKIGDGTIGDNNDGDGLVDIPDEFLIKHENDPLIAIVGNTYPSLLQNFNNSKYLENRVILAPTHEIIDRVNEYMLSLLLGEKKIYLSSDSICKIDMNAFTIEDLHTPEFRTLFDLPVFQIMFLN